MDVVGIVEMRVRVSGSGSGREDGISKIDRMEY